MREAQYDWWTKPEHHFPKRGLHGHVDASAGSNNNLGSFGGRVTATSKQFTVGISALKSQTDDYRDGAGETIRDSDVLTEQGKLYAGWRYRSTGHILLSVASLHKDYGIPNSTDAATRIDMQRESYTVHLSEQNTVTWLDSINLDMSYSDYLHDETEGGRKDGLFGQQTFNTLLSADYYYADWYGKMMFGYRNNELQVCHEHGACEDFTTAYRSGIEANVGASLENYLNARGLPYSHGHPMPNTRASSLTIGGHGERPLELAETRVYLSVGAHIELRQLVADPGNIQETWLVPERIDADYYRDDTDFASSLSVGLTHPLGDTITSQINLSYLQRLPSTDELYWNGFHHATDSYIFGNRELKKEQSINLDWDLDWSTASADWSLSSFVYFFHNYIYQDLLYNDAGEPTADPFHLSDVWQTLQSDAVFSGLSLRNEWKIANWKEAPVVLTNQAEILSAKRSNGENLPRSAPYNWLIGIAYAPERWSAKVSLKHVFKASETAENETTTPGYTWLSLYADWNRKLPNGDLKLWVKGENLTNSEAQNHLSFLKDSAPLMGLQLSTGFVFRF